VSWITCFLFLSARLGGDVVGWTLGAFGVICWVECSLFVVVLSCDTALLDGVVRDAIRMPARRVLIREEVVANFCKSIGVMWSFNRPFKDRLLPV
jgi:hypothetical protein